MRARERWVRIAAAAVFAALGLGFLLWWIPRAFLQQPLHRYEVSRLASQVANLRAYAARDTLAGFLPPGDAVVALREEFVQRALDLSLPFRENFADAGYEAVLDAAELRIEDGLASVRLTGRGRRRGETNPDREVALSLRGYLNAERVHPGSGTLDLGLVVTDVRSARTGPRLIRNWLHPAARYFASLKAEDWNRNRHVIQIPIRLDQRIEMPEVRGDVSIAGRRVQVAVHTSALTAYDRRIAVSLAFAAAPESVPSGASAWTEGMGAATLGASRIRTRRSEESLLAERQRLEERVRALAERDSLWRALSDSDRDITAAVPEVYLERLSRHFVRHYLSDAEIDLGPGLRAQFEQEIRIKILGKSVGAGKIRGSVRVIHLRGRLRPAEDLDLTLRPPNRLEFKLPVIADSGRGRLRLDVDWDPAFLTGAVCKSFHYADTLEGEALPFRHALRGTVSLALSDSFLVGTTRVQRDRVPIPVVPLPAARAKLRSVLEEQDRFSRCGLAMDADKLLENILGRVRDGIAVRLPGNLFPAFRLPVTLVNEYGAGDFRIQAQAYDPEFVVRPSCLLVGFRARLRVEPAPDTTATSAGRYSGPPLLRPVPRRSSARTTRG